MLDFREKSRIRRFLYAKPTIIFMVIVSIFIANGAWNMYQKSNISISNKETAEKELSTLQERETALSDDIQNLSTERGIEEEIRERFMVAKEGESVFVVSNPDDEKVHTITVTETSKPTLIQKILGASGFSE